MECPCLCLRFWHLAMPILGVNFCRYRQLNERVDCSGIPEKWEGKVLKIVSNKVLPHNCDTTHNHDGLHPPWMMDDLCVALTELDVTQNLSACIRPRFVEYPPYADGLVIFSRRREPNANICLSRIAPFFPTGVARILKVIFSPWYAARIVLRTSINTPHFGVGRALVVAS